MAVAALESVCALCHPLPSSPARVDVVHGHSSHHTKGAEVYRGRLVLYGCGDLISVGGGPLLAVCCWLFWQSCMGRGAAAQPAL